MTFSEELQHTLQTMGFVQLLLVLVFLGAYVLALSGLTGAVGRQRAAVLALGAAVGFAAVTPAWAIGAMLMVLAVAGIGLFVAAVLALDRFSASRGGAGYGYDTDTRAMAGAESGSAAAPERRRLAVKQLSIG
jgi:hypothetical protein